eukprot:9991314-Lingulodinium_polyedra.AAC.1
MDGRLPLGPLRAGRWQAVFAELAMATFVGLQGTRDRLYEPVEQHRFEGHMVFRWTAGRGKFTN